MVQNLFKFKYIKKYLRPNFKQQKNENIKLRKNDHWHHHHHHHYIDVPVKSDRWVVGATPRGELVEHGHCCGTRRALCLWLSRAVCSTFTLIQLELIQISQSASVLNPVCHRSALVVVCVTIMLDLCWTTIATMADQSLWLSTNHQLWTLFASGCCGLASPWFLVRHLFCINADESHYSNYLARLLWSIPKWLVVFDINAQLGDRCVGRLPLDQLIYFHHQVVDQLSVKVPVLGEPNRSTSTCPSSSAISSRQDLRQRSATGQVYWEFLL